MGSSLSTGKEFEIAYAAAQKDSEMEATKGGRQGHVAKSVRRLSHNTVAITFEGSLAFTAGGHVSIRSDTAFSRSYTPFFVGPDSFTIAVKKYPEGKVSTYLNDRVRPGDFVAMSAPIPPRFNVATSMKGEAGAVLAVVGGGTGIAPVYSMANHLARLPNNKSNIVIFGCFRNEEDVLLGDELVALAAFAPTLVSVYLVFSRPGPSPPTTYLGLPVLTGRFAKEHLQGRLEKATFAAVCGPPGFGPSVADVLEENVNVRAQDVTIM
ncbi:nitrate reductase, putative [Bodo saltans]|uniref:NADH-cytochrome b5 reductase n=1 Tax=Bodo saltans TaxID=75058 RepID=A0A0S4JK74_BODSA|nr:nitrate reductase, putative [Bodo saltans]|eukprot:CUG90513.1 nitrate reductase, putative [Bodo saltans]